MTNIAIAIDNLMTLYRNRKGVIHTTPYKQLNFKENISQTDFSDTIGDTKGGSYSVDYINSTLIGRLNVNVAPFGSTLFSPHILPP